MLEYGLPGQLARILPVAVGDIEQCLGGPYRSLHKTLSVGIFTYQR